MAEHAVFVIGADGFPLTPTTRARARRLLRSGAAVPDWSRFRTFGIRLIGASRSEVPETVLGIDPGSAYDGYAVVCGRENSLSVNADVPRPETTLAKLRGRARLRRVRRARTGRRTGRRADNRPKNAEHPSLGPLRASRRRIVRELCRIFPVPRLAGETRSGRRGTTRGWQDLAGLEVCGARANLKIVSYRDYQCADARTRYGYTKSRNKGARSFTAHCADALAMAVQTGPKSRVEPGRFITIDESRRPGQRRWRAGRTRRGNPRVPQSGVLRGVRVGRTTINPRGVPALVADVVGGRYILLDWFGRRMAADDLPWISCAFHCKHTKHTANNPVPTRGDS